MGWPRPPPAAASARAGPALPGPRRCGGRQREGLRPAAASGQPASWGRRLLLLVLALGQVGLSRGDLNFAAFSSDPVGRDSHIRLVGGSSLDYYSGEFAEKCSEVGAAAISNPTGITQRFEHAQRREEPDRGSLPSHTYLADDQLDNPYAGRISFGNYTEVVVTDEFVPDGDLLPLPHSRSQLCHYALRITPPEQAVNTAGWSRFKQLVAYGFETEFHFRVLHRTSECVSAGLQSEWCHKVGADGFAFVVQNEGRKAVGTQVGGLGYAIPHSLAIEFDMYRNPEHMELNGNHISVHMPRRIGQPNSANHEVASVAYTEDIPPLQTGTHVVRIAYSTKHYSWDGRSSGFEDDLKARFLQLHASGRLGLLTVELDGRRVLAVPLDLVAAVQVDTTATAQADPPRQPNVTAYDELGATPGRAWVGFTGSTNYFQHQAVDILSWTFKEEKPCPEEGHGDMLCGISAGTEGRSTCARDGSELCTLVLQNAARQPLKFSAHLSWDKPFEATACERGYLQWDQLHPYFLGCARTVRFPHELEELWINTLDGTRSLTVTEAHILQKAPQPFTRRSFYRWCVVEHRTNPSRLQLSQCNCEYCVRLLTLQSYYGQHYQQRCAPRFGLTCQCLEASEADHDMSQWMVQEPLTNMRLHVCRGCGYNSQCSRTLKVAICEPAYQPYTVGNPLAPTILSNGFRDLKRDDGRVLDGEVRGDACNCEPEISPYAGDNSGRKGQCREDFQLSIGNFNSMARCSQFCKDAANCAFFAYWENDGECRIYVICIWQICSNARCLEGSTFKVAPLGAYTDLRGEVQEFNAYPLRTVQTTELECLNCLHLYEEEHCAAQCGPIAKVPYAHWPGGQLCSSCIFAGNRMHELNQQQVANVKACVYQATRVSEDPWAACDEAALENGGVPALDLFNGVVTHHLSECPGRPFDEVGSVCVPNLHVKDMFKHQLLSRMAAIRDTVWGPSLECLNSLCQLVPKTDCYSRLAVFNFSIDYGDPERNIGAHPFNGAALRAQGLELKKQPEQYVLSDLLQFPLENITLEAWVTVSDIERVTNLAVGMHAEANTDWSLDYLPEFALDGDYDTYWSSQLGRKGNNVHRATWAVDLHRMEYAGGLSIYWKEAAKDFQVWVSDDNVTWRLLVSVVDNINTSTTFNTFFFGRYMKVNMTKALEVRPRGPGEDQPVFSIREVEVKLDDNLARLRPVMVSNYWSRPGVLAIDGDWETWWSTPPHTGSAEVYVDLSKRFEVMIVRVHWRYPPQKFKIFLGDQPCALQEPVLQLATFSGSFLPSFVEEVAWRRVQCVRVSVLETKEVFGENLVAIREVEAYEDGRNIAPEATVVLAWPREVDGMHLTPLNRSLDGDPGTYWFLQPVDGTMTLTLDLGSVRRILSVVIRWASINGQRYFATQYLVLAGTSLDDMMTKDLVSNYLRMERRFLLNEDVQYIQLQVNTIMGSNPQGRLALEDIIIHEISDNIASRCESVVNVSSAWCDAETSGHACVGTTSTTTTATTTTATISTTTSSTTTSSTATTTTATTATSTSTTISTSTTSTTTTTRTVTYTNTTYTNTTTSTTSTATNTTTTTATTMTTTVTTTSSTTSSTSTSSTTSTVTTTSITTTTFFTTTTTETVTRTTSTQSTSTQTTFTITTGTQTITTTTLPNYRICDKPVLPQQCVYSTTVPGTDRTHGADKVVDNDLESWWGVTDIEGNMVAYFDFYFEPSVPVGLVGIRWRFPATQASVWCTSVKNGMLQQVGFVEDITSYKTAIPFEVGVRLCAQVRVYLGPPLARFAKEGVLGVREIEIYDTTNNLALNRPISASDGTMANFANDMTPVTKWLSTSNDITYLTVDLGSSQYIWGLRLLYPTGTVPQSFCVMSSDDNQDYQVEESVTENHITDVYLLARFTARYLRVYFMQSVYIVFSVRSLEVYGSPNVASAGHLQSSVGWPHSGMEAVDGNGRTFWVSEPLATSATLQVDLLQRIFVGGGIRIRWKFPAEDFTIWISNRTDSADAWQLLYDVRGNTENVSQFTGFWEAQYVELRMERPSPGNGDGSYAIYDFDVLFDENLAHYKSVSASHRINETMFSEVHAADDDPRTYWMPEQGSDNSSISFDLVVPYLVAGFDISWRRAPVTFYVDRQDPDDLQWYFVARWETPRFFTNVGSDQSWFDGFPAIRVRINIEETEPSAEGKLCALREVLFYVPRKVVNLALNRQVTVSQEDIVGNRGLYITDGNDRGTYWQPGEGVRSAWVLLQLDPLSQVPGERPPGHDVGHVQVFWRFAPVDYSVEFEYDNMWTIEYSETNSDALMTDFSMRRKVTRIRITINTATTNTEIGIKQIKVWKSFALLPPRVDPRNTSWLAPASTIIDHSYETYWMSPPLQDRMNVWVDLHKVYIARDVQIWFGFRPQRVSLWVSEDGVTEVEKLLTSTDVFGLLRLEDAGLAFKVRYLRIWMLKGFVDEELNWGTTIRDVAVLLFRNLARNKTAIADSAWAYAPTWAVDGDVGTQWVSRFGQQQATLIIDLGEPKNVAGMEWTFGYGAARFEVLYSLNGSTWLLSQERRGNRDLHIVVNSTEHFRGRYVMLDLFEAITREYPPDEWGNEFARDTMFSISEVKVWEHTGGGGVFGIQSNDGMEYHTVAYGLRQPGEWVLSSERDILTEDLRGPNAGSYDEDLGGVAHLVVTFQTISRPSPNEREVEISFYRNGFAYGDSYRKTEPANRLRQANATRIVLGVRSSAHSVQPGSQDPREGVIHGMTHSPYFEGVIHNVTVIRNALTPEEVLGLYQVMHKGGEEKGCHCFDACPTGSNRFFPGYPVPCSGQGVCRRFFRAVSLAPGRCDCNPGYSGEACQHHCSELSQYGCCEVDDDCPQGIFCVQSTKACSV